MKRNINLNWKKIMGALYLLAITFISLHIKIWWIKNIPTKPVFDFAAYQEIATNLFHSLGHSYNKQPIAFQGMGYPATLGMVYKLVGNNNEMTAKIFNIILSMLTLVIVYLILIKITHRKPVIYGAYTITALLPNYIAYNNVIGTEIFFTFLFAVILLLQIYHFKPWIRYPLWGFFIGIAALTKPFFMAYPIVAAFMYWLKTKKIRKTAFTFIFLSIITALVIAPWTYRNYKKFGRFIPISYNSGYVLYINNNDYNATGAWMDLHKVKAPKKVKEEVSRILSEKDVKVAHEIEPIIKKQAKKWIMQNPLEFAKLGTLRLSATFFDGSWDIDAWAMNDTKKVMKEYKTWNKKKQTIYKRNKNFSRNLRDMCIHILNSAGILYAFISVINILKALFKKDYKLKDDILFPTIPVLFFMAVYFVYEGQSRYAFPLHFLFAISAMIMLDATVRNFRSGGE